MTVKGTAKNLIIYKASAGSGKTFTLVKEYIALLLGVGEKYREPERFRHILIVTFTNKATAELRERILDELYKMSIGEDSSMLQQIIEEQRHDTPTLDYQSLKSRYQDGATELLKEILGDYTSFRVQTIDSFFQEVVKSFVFELSSAKAGAEIELSNTEAINTSLEKLLRELDKEDPIFKWVQTLYDEALKEGNRFNVQQSAASVAEKLLYSEYEQIITESDEYTPENIARQKVALKSIITTAEEEIGEVLEKIRTLLENDIQLAEDSYYTFLKKFFTNEVPDFIKDCIDSGYIFHKTVQSKVEKGEDFDLYKKNPACLESKDKLEKVKPELIPLLKFFIDVVNKHTSKHTTANILIKHLDLIPIMRALKSKLEEYQNDNNILLISEVNDLMKEIIAGSSVPFIYEKVGGKISNYMIDEFQDTNHTQWENFRPLLEESLDSGEGNKDSYLVGDVKQSIYRWRGADSSILNSKVGEDFNHRVEERVLGTNWRSDGNIINFNNTFFNDIYDFESHTSIKSAMDSGTQKKVATVYNEGVEQKVGKNESTDQGYVSVVLAEKEKKGEQEELAKGITIKQAERLKSYIDECIDSGYEPRDIAFLVRDNKEAVTIAAMLESFSVEALDGTSPDSHPERYKFLSNEALLINHSTIVQIIVATIRHQVLKGAYSTDVILEVMLKRFFYNEHTPVDVQSIKDTLLHLPAEQYSILEFSLQIVTQLGDIPNEEKIYLNAFLDLVTEFMEKRTPTYVQFCIWWDNIKDKKYIEMGDADLNAIQILTIHKSKGLEFPIVILPFADWKISKNSGYGITICSREDIKGFELPGEIPLFSHYIVPDTTSQTHLNSNLGGLYKRIYEENYMDNLNLLYVAFTRAVNRLYVVCNKVSSKEPFNLVSDIIHNRINIEGAGIPKVYGEKSDKASKPTMAQVPPITLQRSFVPNSLLNTESGVRDSKKYSDEYTEKGIMLHDVMSRSLDTKDIEKALKRLVLQHDISEDEYLGLLNIAQESIKDNPTIQDWFMLEDEKQKMHPTLCHRTILNEAMLYNKMERKTLRPDRVILDQYEDNKKEATIIDYKFGQKDSRYHRQVLRYMKHFQNSGFQTRGYLWYNLTEVEEIK